MCDVMPLSVGYLSIKKFYSYKVYLQVCFQINSKCEADVGWKTAVIEIERSLVST